MSRPERIDSTRRNGDSYTVGYGKPPRHTQFRPGQSGNSAGRTKGVRNFKTDVIRTLKLPVKVKDGGRTRTISTIEGILMRLREKALQGDARACDRVLELATRYSIAPGESGATPALSVDDRAILDSYRVKVRAEMTPTSAQAGRQERVRLVEPVNFNPKKENDQ
jgi:Family of unknown function (DUF5681)